MEIEDKYLKMLGKCIYNKQLDKFGYINSLEIMASLSLGLNLKAFYDYFDSDCTVFFEDFTKGKIQFTIIQGYSILKSEQVNEINKEQIKDIKTVFGDDFTDDMLMFIDDNERQIKIQEQEQRETQRLHTDIVSLTNVTVKVLAKDFYSRELYLKWKNKVLSETQFLYALVNHLAQEMQRIDKRNLDYFVKYELEKL